MKYRFILFLALAISCTLCADAQEKKSFWSHGLGKLLKNVDDAVNRMQDAGLDSSYIRKQKYDRMVYVGYY